MSVAGGMFVACVSVMQTACTLHWLCVPLGVVGTCLC